MENEGILVSHKKQNVAILYWGSRGGPIRQLDSLMRTANDLNLILTWIFSSNTNEFPEKDINRNQIIKIQNFPKSKISMLFNFVAKKRAINETIAYLKANGIRRVYILLPHPWDITLARKLFKKTNIEVWRGIHDLEPHVGEIWPTKFAIKRAIKFSNLLVVYSDYIMNRIANFGKSVFRATIFDYPIKKDLNSIPGNVLFIGRIKKYKGLDLLSKSWNLVKNQNKNLTIAGEGDPTPFKASGDIRIIKKWLTDNEIEELILSSSIVVLPYIEASQSGIISIALAANRPVVITPVGGLIDQVENNVNGIISTDLTPESLAEAIDLALSKKWELTPKNNPNKYFIEQFIN